VEFTKPENKKMLVLIINILRIVCYTSIPPEVKRVIFRLTLGFIGDMLFRYTHLKAEVIVGKLD